SELLLETAAGDNGRVVECTAGNGLDKPVHRQTVLDVTHDPLAIYIPRRTIKGGHRVTFPPVPSTIKTGNDAPPRNPQ
ncbi:hypothetical protein Pmani_039365, partial [Petrolisthes manimaculis]